MVDLVDVNAQASQVRIPRLQLQSLQHCSRSRAKHGRSLTRRAGQDPE
jgi:hypothetical protein